MAGAVLGILTEPDETEVFDSNPDILREQLITWSNEFFSTGQFRGRLSQLEELNSDGTFSRGRSSSTNNPYYSYAHESSSGDISGRTNTFRGRLHAIPSSATYSSGGDYYHSHSRVNARYHDVTRSEGRPTIKEENLEWMLQNVFMYPRSHSTNETAKEIARKYIIDSFKVTSGLYTSVQHFRALQFLNMVRDT